MAVTDFEQLKVAVIGWLTREGEPVFEVRAEDFIQIAHDKIFRRYRARWNEAEQTYIQKETPGAGEVPIGNTFALPEDYLEALTFQEDGTPMERKSLDEIMWRTRADNQRSGRPRMFARDGDNLVCWPFPDGERSYRIKYYQKHPAPVFGQVPNTNNVLLNSYDLYLYGALSHAEPFERTEQVMKLLAVWEKKYDEAFSEIEFDRDEEARSGSNVEVQSAFSGGSNRAMPGRTGWT